VLTGQQKVTIRRQLRYPAIGVSRTSVGGQSLASGGQGFRYFQAYGRLEYILNNLQPYEEAQIIGSAVGSISILGLTAVGDTVSVTLSGAGLVSPVTLTVTAVLGDNPVSLSNKLAALALQNPALISAGFMAVTPYGTGPFAQNAVPLPEVAFFNPKPFTIAAAATGQTGSAVTTDGSPVTDPIAIVDDSTSPVTTLTGFIPILIYLEGAIAGTTQNLDTSKADVWTARTDEPEMRIKLYNYWRRALARHLEVPLWEDFNDYGGGVPTMATI